MFGKKTFSLPLSHRKRDSRWSLHHQHHHHHHHHQPTWDRGFCAASSLSAAEPCRSPLLSFLKAYEMAMALWVGEVQVREVSMRGFKCRCGAGGGAGPVAEILAVHRLYGCVRSLETRVVDEGEALMKR